MANIQNIIKTYNSYEIDSLRIRIPTSNIKTIDLAKIGLITTIVDYTSEVIEQKARSYKNVDGPIHTYWKVIQYTLNNENYQELEIIFHSKILGKRYFKGITNSDIKYIYDKLQSYQIAEFSYESFLNSKAYDVDIKKDFHSKIATTQELLSVLTKKSISDFTHYTDFNHSKKRDNIGLLYGSRQGRKNKDVNLKFYQKEIELKVRSYKFFNEFFNKEVLQPTLRVEYNINNSQRFKKLGFKHKFTLKTILNLTQVEKHDIFKQITPYHIKSENTMKNKKKSLDDTSTNILIGTLLTVPQIGDKYEGLTKNYLYAKGEINGIVKEKSKKSRLLKILNTKYTELLHDISRISPQENEVLELYKSIFD